MRILIVEDEAIVAFSIDDALTSAGKTVVGIARDEEAAMRLAEEHHPDLALVDLSLARGSSGATVAQALRERYGIPAIFVSSFPLDAAR
jgi:Response regulator containing a CheY-like receiver domain and an HTH DNA-binding domain